MLKLQTPNLCNSSSFQISAVFMLSCYLEPESKYPGDCLHVDYHFDYHPENQGASPKKKSEAETWAPDPPGHTDTAQAIWLFEFKHRFSKLVETKHCFNSPCIIWGVEELFYPSGILFWSHSGNIPWEPDKTHHPKGEVVQRGLNDGGHYRSLILRADSHCPKPWWKLLYVHQLSTAEGRGTCSSVAGSGAEQEPAKGAGCQLSPRGARGILNWENLAAFQPCSSACLYICIYV